jgi:hypothetical protein
MRSGRHTVPACFVLGRVCGNDQHCGCAHRDFRGVALMYAGCRPGMFGRNWSDV